MNKICSLSYRKMIFTLFDSIILKMKIHTTESFKFHIKIWKHTTFHLPIKFSFLTQSTKKDKVLYENTENQKYKKSIF